MNLLAQLGEIPGKQEEENGTAERKKQTHSLSVKSMKMEISIIEFLKQLEKTIARLV